MGRFSTVKQILPWLLAHPSEWAEVHAPYSTAHTILCQTLKAVGFYDKNQKIYIMRSPVFAMVVLARRILNREAVITTPLKLSKAYKCSDHRKNRCKICDARYRVLADEAQYY